MAGHGEQWDMGWGGAGRVSGTQMTIASGGQKISLLAQQPDKSESNLSPVSLPVQVLKDLKTTCLTGKGPLLYSVQES